MDISICEMKASHWDEVRTIYLQGVATGVATFETECPEWEEWDRDVLPDCRLVALSDREIVGWVALRPVSGRCVYGGVAEIVIYALWFGAGRGGGRRGGGGGGQSAVILLILALIFIILAPIFSRLTYLAISRKREYMADANGAYLTRNPEGLASALEKIKGDLPDDPKGSKTVAPLYIANPFKRALRDSIWSTHPPINERIKRLREM